MNQDENDSKSYRKNDLIAVLKKDDKKDPIFLFKVNNLLFLLNISFFSSKVISKCRYKFQKN